MLFFYRQLGGLAHCSTKRNEKLKIVDNVNYQDLIDAETWAFINRTNDYYPPDMIDASIERQREIYNSMCREFFGGYPAGVSALDSSADGVPVRVYSSSGKPKAVMLYLHGGGFVVGGLESHDDVCAELSHRTGCTVISADYRLCPEHPHPAPYDDAMTAYRWIVRQYALPLLLCGDSAGGNLAAAVAHSSRGDTGAPIGQVLIYPGLGGDHTVGSYLRHAEAPMLSTREILFYEQVRLGSATREDYAGDARYAPLWENDFSGLPATVVFGAQCDPLCDDGEQYCQKLQVAGVQAKWVEETGLVHGYLRGRGSVQRVRDSFDRICAAVSGLLT